MNETAKKKKNQRQGSVELFCPYCDRTMPFGHDSYLDYYCCTGCGVSTEDFHTRTKNGLWDQQKKDKVELAIRKSGVVYKRDRCGVPDAAPPERQEEKKLVLGLPPGERETFFRVECACGKAWAALPGATTCPGCLREYRVKDTGEVVPLEDGRLRCPGCSAVLTAAPAGGAAYRCLSCGTWTNAEGVQKKAGRLRKKRR